MDSVMCRPWSDEVEDYVEYKRIRKRYHDDQNDAMHPKLTASTIATDDAGEGAGEGARDGARDGAPSAPVALRKDSVGHSLGQGEWGMCG